MIVKVNLLEIDILYNRFIVGTFSNRVVFIFFNSFFKFKSLFIGL